MRRSRHSKSPENPPRRPLFSLVLLLAPLLILAAVEGSLRLFSYGGERDLVLTTTLRNREFYTLNRAIGKRYFNQPGVAIPEPPDLLFPKHKPPHTKRIFCLGESTMAGFPYEYNATPPSMLKDRLAALLPSDTIEVINAGMSAVGSTVVRDIIGDLLDYEPDLFVIYVGHNEFYGAFGPGSSAPLAGSTWLTRAHLSLMRFRTYLLLRDGLNALRNVLTPERQVNGSTLMEQMVGSGDIAYGSELYARGLSIYRDNIEAIINAAHSHHVPVLFSALVSNLHHQPPFVSLFASATTDPMIAEWNRLKTMGDSLTATGECVAAIELLQRAVALDSMNASGYFALGRTLEAAGRFEAARQAFLRAKDLDALRFRASEEFQHSLLDICQRRAVPVARVDSAFAAASPHGIVGRELILEHLHPNVRGYLLMARTWADAMKEHALLEPADAWGTNPSDSTLLEIAAVSSFDEALGQVKVDQLTRRWAFRPEMSRAASLSHDTVATIVQTALRNGTSWTQARYHVADYYAQRREYDFARRECNAIAKALPYSFQPWIRRGDFFIAEGRPAEAAREYAHSIGVEENPYGHMKLGVLLLQSEHPSDAAAEFEKGFSVDADQKGLLTTAEQAQARSLLAFAYARLGKFAHAKENARKAIALQPGLKEAAGLLRRLP
jgi:tetratricopeptide (TPR) repeat protein